MFHPLHPKIKQHTKKVVIHTAMILLTLDFMAMLAGPILGGILEPLHEILYRTGGVLAVAVYYFEV